MELKTIQRGKDIAENGHVRLCDMSSTFLSFKVKQRNGNWAEVWYKKNKIGIWEWSCNAITEKKNGDKWGCVMNVCVKTKPYCSHTLSVKIFMEERGIKWKQK